jgi:phage terminase large subunit
MAREPQLVLVLEPGEDLFGGGVLEVGGEGGLARGGSGAYLGLEYDVIGIEEATTLSARKYTDITTCCRSSKVLADECRWRPRVYSTTNPGGVGHAWYRRKFVAPYLEKREIDTRFIPARVTDNRYNNPEYQRVLEALTGWQRRAWLEGDWDIAAGQYFTNFRRELHVVADFDESRAVEWWAALDYGFTHYTVVLLGCTDGDGNVFVVDEHAERLWLPQRHAMGIREMLRRHGVPVDGGSLMVDGGKTRPLHLSGLRRFVAGADVFSRQSDGTTIAQQYAREGITLRPASTDRVNGWAEILQRLGDPRGGHRRGPPPKRSLR